MRTPLPGVNIDGGALGVRVSDANGAYSFGSLASGSPYMLIPLKAGYTFGPQSSCGVLDGDVTADFSALLVNTVYPILECVDDNYNGSYTAHFGYHSTYAGFTTIPLGNKNRFRPGSRHAGQPSVFLPGRWVDVFSQVFNGKALTWKVDGIGVSATPFSPRCCPTSLDECGVCGGDGSSCRSCRQPQAGLASTLSKIMTDQSALFAQVTGALAAPRARSLNPLLRRTFVRSVKLNKINGGTASSLVDAASVCDPSAVCLTENVCSIAAQFSNNAARLRAQLLKLQTLLSAAYGKRWARSGPGRAFAPLRSIETLNQKGLALVRTTSDRCGN